MTAPLINSGMLRWRVVLVTVLTLQTLMPGPSTDLTHMVPALLLTSLLQVLGPSSLAMNSALTLQLGRNLPSSLLAVLQTEEGVTTPFPEFPVNVSRAQVTVATFEEMLIVVILLLNVVRCRLMIVIAGPLM